MLEQFPVEFLVPLQTPRIHPLATNSIAHLRQTRHASLRALSHVYEMHAVPGLDRPMPIAERELPELGREFLSELCRDLCGRHGFKPVFEEEGIAEHGDIRFAA